MLLRAAQSIPGDGEVVIVDGVGLLARTGVGKPLLGLLQVVLSITVANTQTPQKTQDWTCETDSKAVGDGMSEESGCAGDGNATMSSSSPPRNHLATWRT